jgi:hypothetical protein
MRAGVGLPAFGGWFPGYPGARVAPQITKDQELEALKGQAQFFNEQLEAIKQRIEELAAQEPGKK